MKHVYAFLADGLEEIECLAVVDILRRAGVEVTMVSIMGGLEVTGAHGIRIGCDRLIGEIDFDAADVLFLPGGLPGTTYLSECALLTNNVVRFFEEGKRIAAICAAPSIFGTLGLLQGKRATCYPGFEDKLKGAVVTGEPVVTDGNVTTAKGMGAAFDLGLELVSLLVDEETAEKLGKAIMYL